MARIITNSISNFWSSFVFIRVVPKVRIRWLFS